MRSDMFPVSSVFQLRSLSMRSSPVGFSSSYFRVKTAVVIDAIGWRAMHRYHRMYRKIPQLIESIKRGISRKKRVLQRVSLCAILIYIVATILTNPNGPTPSTDSMNNHFPRGNRPRFFADYHDCLIDKLTSVSVREIYGSTTRAVDECRASHPKLDTIKVTSSANMDETKYVIPPQKGLKDGEECHVVTLGIGGDVHAELKIRAMLPALCRFSGADPWSGINKHLYQGFGGNYFQTAVGAGSGSVPIRIMRGDQYFEEEVIPQKDLVTFLKKDVGVERVVDLLLIDIETKEFGLMPYFLRGSQLDQNNITVCQFNVEFHWPYRESLKHFGLFLLDILREERYSVLRSYYMSWTGWSNGLIRNHVLRLYLVNIEDPVCVSRYLADANNQ